MATIFRTSMAAIVIGMTAITAALADQRQHSAASAEGLAAGLGLVVLSSLAAGATYQPR